MDEIETTTAYLQSRWMGYCISNPSLERWQLDPNEHTPKPQRKPKSGPMSRETFLDNGIWKVVRTTGVLPIMFYPEICNLFCTDLLAIRPHTKKAGPQRLADAFRAQYDGVMAKDLTWIINNVQKLKEWKEQDARQRWLLTEHPRRAELEKVYVQQNHKDCQNPLRSSLFIGTMLDCLYAHSPVCWGPQKTYDLVDTKELSDALRTARKAKIYLLRDPKWKDDPHRITSEQFLNGFSLSDKRKIVVQDLGRRVNGVKGKPEDGIGALAVATFLSRFRQSAGRVCRTGINVLDISPGRVQITPLPLRAFGDYMRKCCDVKADETLSTIRAKPKEHWLLAGQERTIDDTGAYRVFADVTNCQLFQVFGQAGVMSGWHMDNRAPITWVTLEANRAGHAEEDEALKYWPVIDFANMSQEDVELAKEEFAQYGADWMPRASWIKTFALTPGDTLIFPPGTIHAPISATDCLCRGGMCWDERFVITEHLPWWLYIVQNRRRVSNEDPLKETSGFLAIVMNDICKDPARFHISEEEVPAAIALCQEIIRNSQTCDCEDGCKKGSCLCHVNDLLCVGTCECNGCEDFEEPCEENVARSAEVDPEKGSPGLKDVVDTTAARKMRARKAAKPNVSGVGKGPSIRVGLSKSSRASKNVTLSMSTREHEASSRKTMNIRR